MASCISTWWVEDRRKYSSSCSSPSKMTVHVFDAPGVKHREKFRCKGWRSAEGGLFAFLTYPMVPFCESTQILICYIFWFTSEESPQNRTLKQDMVRRRKTKCSTPISQVLRHESFLHHYPQYSTIVPPPLFSLPCHISTPATFTPSAGPRVPFEPTPDVGTAETREHHAR